MVARTATEPSGSGVTSGVVTRKLKELAELDDLTCDRILEAKRVGIAQA